MKNKNTIKKCDRISCKFFAKGCDNRCSALSSVYENSKKCSFFKEKETKDGFTD